QAMPLPAPQPPQTSAPVATAASVNVAVDVDVAGTLLAIVAEKTGYPTEMLELSMGLDADLGIDSIKRVEILASLQKQLPTAPVIKPEHLGELQTLEDIVAFLSAGMAPVASASAQSMQGTTDIADILLAIVAEKTGYPTEMLELSMGLDADLGIDSIKRVEILASLQKQLPTAPVIKPEHLGELQTLEDIVAFLGAGMATAPVASASAQPSADDAPVAPRGRGSVQRHVLRLAPVAEPTSSRLALPAGSPVWITRDEAGLGKELQRALTAKGFAAELVDASLPDDAPAVPEDLAGLFLVADAAITDKSLKALFALAQKAGAKLAGREAAVFATVSRLDGAFGLEAPTCLVTSGGLAGLAKTAHFEWSRVTCKAFDVDAGVSDDAATATRIVNHAWGTEAVEIGLSADRTVTPILERQALGLEGEKSKSGKKAPRFTDRDVVVVSGGARGVTAEIAVALAAEGQPHLALFGRSPLPESEPAWLAAATDQAAIQKALLENAKLRANATSKMTPMQLRTECRRVLANREIRTNLARIETAGSRVSYLAVDVRDGAAVASAIEAVRGQFGAITGLVHGAGVLADSTIADKTAADFDRVYGTKVEGLEALLAATCDDALRGIVLFSSSTARFGRKGQVDYAMANEVLNKLALREARERPDARVLSVNWGPWDGGMVTPELRQLFTTEGIEVIGLDAGAQYLLRELASDSGPVEVVILGEGSALPQAGLGTAAPSTATTSVTPPHLARRAAAKVHPELPKVFERTLDFETHSFLSSHVLDGKAVLPVAMVIEWLGHGALHGNPGLRFQGFTDLRIFKGLIIAASEKVTVRVGADRAKKAGKEYRVAVELCSGGGNGHRVLHARATIVLGAGAPALASRAIAPAVRPYSVSLDDVYRTHLFHGPAFQGLDSIEGVSEQGIIAASRLAPAPREWITAPPRSHWLADPLAIDCAFQMMILWSLDRDGTPSLPTEAKSYRQFRSAFPSEGTRIEVRVTEHDAHRATADIDWVSPDGELIARMIGYECVIDRSLIEPFRDNTLTVTAAARR
ncbi:MAG: SDR family NAD(P)-dependent oxidoreductase, partial [Deltaproteobacteria bacterium]|nr:SDR family NAD(P)-dependent oxidoreductase [Deltaproteobacteria bacterium]